MSEASKPARPSKRDVIVIDDDDSTNGQPVAKSVKIEEEEPAPSSEVVTLQQKVLKLEEMLQNACRATRIAELRAEEAESRLDSKNGIKEDFHAEKKRADDLEMRLSEVSSQLDGARRRADNVFLTKTELARENDELKMKMADLKRSTATKRGESVNVKNTELTRENESLKRELAELKKSTGSKGGGTGNSEQERLKYLTDQLKMEQRRADDDRSRYYTKLEGLQRKLAKYEKEAEPVEIDQSGNIFQLCLPDSNSISYERAREKLFSAAMKLEGGTLDTKLNQCFDRFPELQSLILECRVCKVVTLQKTSLIMHFFGKPHKNKVRGRYDDSVSRAALQFWLDKFKPDDQPMQQLQQWPRDRCINQLQLPTAAAVTGSSLAAAAAVSVAPQQAAVDAPDLQLVRAATATNSATLGWTAELHEIGIPYNIFQLHPLDWISSMSFENAREQLLSIVKYDEDALIERFMRVAQQELMSLDCRACEMTLNQDAIITHFLSKEHQNKVTTLGAAVSRAAIDYWADKLQSEQSVETAEVAARRVQQPAAAAASPNAVKTPKEIKKEEIDD